MEKKSDELPVRVRIAGDFVLDLAKKLSLRCHLFKTKSITPPAIQKKSPHMALSKIRILKTKRKFSICSFRTSIRRSCRNTDLEVITRNEPI